MTKIAASILSADFAHLASELSLLETAGADYIHIDVMDGHFVPNITVGPALIKSIRPYSKKIFDVHLMISSVAQYIEDFVISGADIITIHAESTIHLNKTINLIKKFGKKVGISLVPSTSLNVLDYILEDIDLVLLMTVNPGFSGQEFIASQLRKIEMLRKKIDKISKNIEIEVDGGINEHTAKLAIEAGADILVAGSYIFSSNNYKSRIDLLRNCDTKLLP